MRVGIDLGGTKIEIAVLKDDEVVWRARTNARRGDYPSTLDALKDLVTQADAFTGRRLPIGIGIPGAISPKTGLIKNANSTWLIGHALDKDMEHILERPVRFANDANCFALSEACDGAAAGKSVVFGVILGTGVGGGIVIDKRVIPGHQAVAGEWGHNPLPWPNADELPGRKCFCGKCGCIETFCSGPGFEADHLKITGNALDAPAIVAAASKGEASAKATMNRYIDRLARSLATIVNVLDPDAIVIGGGLSNADAIYEEVPKLLPRYVFSDSCTTPILKNKHGDSSGVRGAAWLWPEP